MPLVSIICGIILIPIGWVVFDQTGREHKTALFPVVLGGLLVILGALSYRPGWRQHTMHTAAMVGLIGMLGSGFRAILGLIKYFSDEPYSQPALVGTSLTTLICLVFVVLCVNSFIQARRRRQQATE